MAKWAKAGIALRRGQGLPQLVVQGSGLYDVYTPLHEYFVMQLGNRLAARALHASTFRVGHVQCEDLDQVLSLRANTVSEGRGQDVLG
jgi:hypothetical protein